MQLNWLARYLPIVDQLEQITGPVLEVGSGATGIGVLTERRFVGCDVTFERLPIPTMSAVIGSGLHLPFADRRFEAVIASDVLEHIPMSHRGAAVNQLIRASHRWVIIGVPCGAASRWPDAWLARWRLFWRKPLPSWLAEHQALGLPTCVSIDRLLHEQGGIVWKVLPNENAIAHLAFTIVDTTHLVKAFRLLWRWRPAVVARMARLGTWGAPYRRIYIIERVDA